jgi:hypothetical protein
MSKEIDDHLNSKIRSPRLNDKLFIEADDWRMNACLNRYHDPTELYIIGYKEAADSLVDLIANLKRSADLLILPIVFFISALY